jgi:uncharacterized protein (DUF433 family)
MPSTLSVSSEAPPLHGDSDGGFRVGDSRVLLEMVIHAFQQGETPEGIVQRFPSTKLSDVYAVIAYYLRHRAEVDTYLTERNREGETVRRRIEQAQGDMGDLRARLLSRRSEPGL